VIVPPRLTFEEIEGSLRHPHTKAFVNWGSFSMEWEGDGGNKPESAWGCNPDSTRWKPRSASYILSLSSVHKCILSILYVCPIYISRWCNIDLNGGPIISSSHHERCFLTQASRQHNTGQSPCPAYRPGEEAKCRLGNKMVKFGLHWSSGAKWLPGMTVSATG